MSSIKPDSQRIVITGRDAICSLGHSVKEVWNNICKGQSGVKQLPDQLLSEPGSFPTPVDIAGFVENFQISDELLTPKEKDRFDLFTHYALHCISNALEQSGLKTSKFYKDEKIGCILGIGMGGFPFIGETHASYISKSRARVNPFFIPSIIPNMASGLAAIKFGLKGSNFTTSSACASSGHAIETAMSFLKSGYQDAIVVGGSEAVITKFTITGFHSMKALSRRECEPHQASCPFDENRDGFVMGEGAGILILETLENAKKRGAKIFAEIIGTGSSCDAHHITSPDPDGKGARASMLAALDNASIKPSEIQYINAHGTSTPLGDIAETNAIKKVFKDHAYNLNVSSTKSMTGHLLGAASALESVICIKALEEQMIPPTINLNQPSEECDLNYTANSAQEKNLEYVMNNSFGFGGTNSTIIFKRYCNK